MSQQKSFTLILLYDKISASLPVAQALKEKDIDVHIAQNAGELIQSIATRDVDMVGLSVNHASSRSLIQVLREKTQVKILIFGEDKALSTAEKVDRFDGDFKVLGMATAYNIWMKIALPVKNKLKDNETNGNILYSGGKASSQKGDQSIIIKSLKQEKKERFPSPEGAVPKKKKKDKKDKQVEQTEVDSLLNNQELPTTSDENEVLFFKKNDEEKKSSLPRAKNKLKDKKAKKQTEDVSEQDGVVMVDEASNGAMDGEVITTLQEDNEQVGTVQDLTAAENENNGKILKFDKKKKKDKKSKEENDERGDKAGMMYESPIKTPLKESVLNAVKNAFTEKEENAEGFESVSRMTVVPIDNHETRGFLILCAEDNQFINPTHSSFEQFREVLLAQMNAESGDLGESYNVEMEETNLKDWVLSQSDFHSFVEDPKTLKSVLICFVAKEAIYPDINKEQDLNMLKVELGTFPVSTPVNFNIFLYLARNKKVIPYLRPGGKFTEEQMSRLGKHGVESIYVSENDRNALYSFYISQTLSQDLRTTKKAA